MTHKIKNKPKDRILVGVTGASGAIYAERLIHALYPLVDRLYLVLTDSGEKVAQYELATLSDGFSLMGFLKDAKAYPKIRRFDQSDLFAPIASGTSAPTQMVVVPCSMGTLSRIAYGTSSNLLERSADVMLKQQRPLILVPRETPLSSIHLENMLRLSRLGVQLIPAMPGFYLRPKELIDLVDFVVGRILESMGFEHVLYKPWNSRMI